MKQVTLKSIHKAMRAYYSELNPQDLVLIQISPDWVKVFFTRVDNSNSVGATHHDWKCLNSVWCRSYEYNTPIWSKP